MRTVFLSALLGWTLLSMPLPVSGQILHQFSWNDDTAPPTQADVGPNATSISTSAGIISAGGNGTPGLAANPGGATKLDIEMNFPAGPSANVVGIDIAYQYNRQENSGTTLVRGTFSLGQADGLNVTYQVRNADNTLTTVSSPLFATARDGVIDAFRFTYDSDSGTGRLFLNNSEVWTDDGPDGLPLAWSTDTWLLGNQIDASGEQPAQVVFDELVIQDIPSASVLPVELTSFQAHQREDATVALSWRTASERDNDYFAVERSGTGDHWIEIERVPGNGTTGRPTDYTAIDYERITAVRYYRLRQVDFDGTSSLSPVVSVGPGSDGAPGLVAYPNPTTGPVRLIGSAGPPRIFTIGGREITPGTGNVGGGAAGVSLDLGDLPPGLYVLRRGAEQVRVVKR